MAPALLYLTSRECLRGAESPDEHRSYEYAFI